MFHSFVIKKDVFWDMTMCKLLITYRLFRLIFYPPHHVIPSRVCRAVCLLHEMAGVICSDIFFCREVISHFTLHLHKPGNAYAYKRYIEARSRNQCCRGKAINIIYSESVLVALGIQHVVRMRHIVIHGFSGSKRCFFPNYFIFFYDFHEKLNFFFIRFFRKI